MKAKCARPVRGRLSWRKQKENTLYESGLIGGGGGKAGWDLWHAKTDFLKLPNGWIRTRSCIAVVRFASDAERRAAARGGGPWYFEVPSTGRNSLLAGERYRSAESAKKALLAHVRVEIKSGRLR